MENSPNISPYIVEMHDAEVRRSSRTILKVDDFRLGEGESIAILGPNGSGKSTFVSLITREIFPLHRDVPPVLFCGSANTSLEELKSQIGFVSSTMQKQIEVHLPAIEIVQGGLFGSLGVPKRFQASDEDHDRAIGIMDGLGIADLAYRDMKTLSTGQARRVLIARALIHDPKMLVFDEPTTGLDPAGMYHVRQAMEDIAATGRSIVLVTHYPEDIVKGIGRVLLIKDGEVFADGLREELLCTQVLSDLFEIPFDQGIERR